MQFNSPTWYKISTYKWYASYTKIEKANEQYKDIEAIWNME